MEVVFPKTGTQIVPLKDLDQEKILKSFADALIKEFCFDAVENQTCAFDSYRRVGELYETFVN